MNTYTRRRISTASERAALRATRGWIVRREQVKAKAKATPEIYPDRLLGRLVAVNEISGTVKEFSIFRHDNDSSIRRKVREAGKAIFA